MLQQRDLTAMIGVVQPDRPSQRDGLFEHPVAKQVIEASLRHDLDATTEQFFQLGDQTARKPGARIRSDLDEKIDVTLRSRITTRHRAKHLDLRDAVPASQSENLFSLRSYEVHHRICSLDWQCTVFRLVLHQAA
jgi:hypothetical protein